MKKLTPRIVKKIVQHAELMNASLYFRVEKTTAIVTLIRVNGEMTLRKYSISDAQKLRSFLIDQDITISVLSSMSDFWALVDAE